MNCVCGRVDVMKMKGNICVKCVIVIVRVFMLN